MEVIRHSHKLAELEKAVAWLRTLTKVPEGSRFPVYLKIWAEIVDRSDLPNGGTSDDQIRDVITKYGENEYRGAIHEAFDLAFIHRAFRNCSQIIPISLLEKVVKGSFSEVEEVASKPETSQPRNFLFELTVAARFRSSGFSVVLTNDADIEFNFQNHRVFIECKRLFRSAGFDANFRKGSSQLEKRFSKFGLPTNLLGYRPLGILMFCITKVVNPTQSFLSVTYPNEANARLNEETLKMLRDNETRIKANLNPNTILLGFYTHIPLKLSEDFGSYIRWNFFPYHDSSHNFSNVATAIVTKLDDRHHRMIA